MTTQKYIGTKILTATPMNRLEYNLYRGWDLPLNEDGNDEGYLVEYQDGGAQNHPDHAGYISWSPKAVFEQAYRPVSGLSFGLAIEALKKGHRVAREGWNGKGMWLALSGSLDGREIPAGQFWNVHNADHARAMGGTAKVLPCITMKTADNAILMGWLASQTDMLAEDWYVVPDA